MTDDDGGWRVELTRTAQRDLRRLDPQIRSRALAAIEGMIGDPPRGDFQRLTGSTDWRLRVGDWRVRFARDHDESQGIERCSAASHQRSSRALPCARCRLEPPLALIKVLS